MSNNLLSPTDHLQRQELLLRMEYEFEKEEFKRQTETMLATVKVARLAAYYEYDVTLMNLLALCGTPEQFRNYAVK